MGVFSTRSARIDEPLHLQVICVIIGYELDRIRAGRARVDNLFPAAHDVRFVYLAIREFLVLIQKVQ